MDIGGPPFKLNSKDYHSLTCALLHYLPLPNVSPMTHWHNFSPRLAYVKICQSPSSLHWTLPSPDTPRKKQQFSLTRFNTHSRYSFAFNIDTAMVRIIQRAFPVFDPLPHKLCHTDSEGRKFSLCQKEDTAVDCKSISPDLFPTSRSSYSRYWWGKLLERRLRGPASKCGPGVMGST